MAERLWVHNDKLGLQHTVDLGMQRAASGDWASGSMGERVRAFNGWILERCRLMAGFWGEVSYNPNGQEVYVYPGKLRNVPDERARAAIALYRTAWILQEEDLRNGDELSTTVQAGEAAGWPVIAAAAIVAVGQVVAIAYCVEKAAQVLDRELARREDLRKLVQRDKAILDLAAQHQAREEKAGKQLPLDQVTKQAVDSLLQQQEAIVKKTETPLQSGLPSLPSMSNITAGASGFGSGAIAAILGVGFLLVWSK